MKLYWIQHEIVMVGAESIFDRSARRLVNIYAVYYKYRDPETGEWSEPWRDTYYDTLAKAQAYLEFSKICDDFSQNRETTTTKRVVLEVFEPVEVKFDTMYKYRTPLPN